MWAWLKYVRFRQQSRSAIRNADAANCDGVGRNGLIHTLWLAVKGLSKALPIRENAHNQEALMRSARKYLGIVTLSLSIAGCGSMNFDKLSASGPEFDFLDYFEGHTRASGWFADRFGNVKRHFCGDFYGESVGDVFNLDEKLFYSDGIVEERLWAVSIDENGQFKAVSDSLVGPASGEQVGSALRMKYVMNVMIAENKFWKLDMNDYMFYQPDGSLHNSTEVNKWGVRLGNVSTQYHKHDGSQTCEKMEVGYLEPVKRLSVVS